MRFLRPAKIEDQLAHVRAFLETRDEAQNTDRVALVNIAWSRAHEIWPDDSDVLREHAERGAMLAGYRAVLE